MATKDERLKPAQPLPALRPTTVDNYAEIQLQRSRDMVLSTEFQNALFASALGINNKFCLIIKRDGNIHMLGVRRRFGQ